MIRSFWSKVRENKYELKKRARLDEDDELEGARRASERSQSQSQSEPVCTPSERACDHASHPPTRPPAHSQGGKPVPSWARDILADSPAAAGGNTTHISLTPTLPACTDNGVAA